MFSWALLCASAAFGGGAHSFYDFGPVYEADIVGVQVGGGVVFYSPQVRFGARAAATAGSPVRDARLMAIGGLDLHLKVGGRGFGLAGTLDMLITSYDANTCAVKCRYPKWIDAEDFGIAYEPAVGLWFDSSPNSLGDAGLEVEILVQSTSWYAIEMIVLPKVSIAYRFDDRWRITGQIDRFTGGISFGRYSY